MCSTYNYCFDAMPWMFIPTTYQTNYPHDLIIMRCNTSMKCCLFAFCMCVIVEYRKVRRQTSYAILCFIFCNSPSPSSSSSSSWWYCWYKCICMHSCNYDSFHSVALWLSKRIAVIPISYSYVNSYHSSHFSQKSVFISLSVYHFGCVFDVVSHICAFHSLYPRLFLLWNS